LYMAMLRELSLLFFSKSFLRVAQLCVIGSAMHVVVPVKADFLEWFRDEPISDFETSFDRAPLLTDRPSQPEHTVTPRGVQRQPGPPRAGGGELADAKDALAEFRAQSRTQMPIRITRIQWTDADEKQFGVFVGKLGKAIAGRKCNTVKKCMRSPEANIYAGRDPKDIVLYSDCADFPYFLRAYFAFHNGLPFGYVTDLKMNTRAYASTGNQDALLSQRAEHNGPYGNVLLSRGGANVASGMGAERDLISYLETMFDVVSTRTYRVGVLTPGFELSDLYPVKIDRQGIEPGAIVHSTGHALVVWNIDREGVIKVIDAHPDGSVQFKNIQPSTLDRSRPDQGLGFYRFRPLELIGAQQDSSGYLFGGHIRAKTDQDLFSQGRWSLEQWFGPGSQVAPGSTVDPMLWTKGYKKVGFFDYLARKLRDEKVEVRADAVVGEMMKSLCDQMQQRVTDVDTAIQAGVSQQPHPETLPADIFGEEDPTWGKYSTPGRDSRLRGFVADIIKSAVGQFRAAKAGDRSIKFEGTARAYVAALRARIKGINESCLIRYANSKGNMVTLTFTQVLARLAKMSFDPYLCPEKAWGASGAELATCVDSDVDGSWYAGEQNMRNVTGRLSPGDVPVIRSSQPISKAMLFDSSLIDQSDTADTNLGTATAPIVNLDSNFASPRFLQLLNK
jgi:hypothetical protein